MLDVSDQRILDLANAAVVHRRVLPSEVSELGVDRDADHFNAALLEFVKAVIEGDQFGRANEGEVERVKEDYRILALDFLGQGKGANFIVAHDGVCGEVRGLLANENSHVISP